MGMLTEHLSRYHARNHQRILELADRVSEEDFDRSMGRSLHSLAYQVWHVARWNDIFARFLAGGSHALADAGYPGAPEPVEIWVSDDLAEKWGLPAGKMGRRDSGTSMDDGEADRLRWPSRAEVIDYASRAFALDERIISAIPENDLLLPAPRDPDGDTYAENALHYAEHDSRHLGMMEAMVGLLGGRGTATR
jgi:uncharacterized damage-inducible protein DinB